MNAAAPATDCLHTVKVRMANGQIKEGPLSPRRQARLYSLIVHSEQFGMVEAIRATRPEGGKRLTFPHRPQDQGDVWLSADNPDELGSFVEAYRDDYELFVTPATFETMTPGYAGVAGSKVAWIDQDEPDKVELLRQFPHRPHMVVTTGGSGGVHAYWRLAYPVGRDEIGVVNRKLVLELDADRAAHNPGRILRVPGSRNFKANHAEEADGLCRIVWADLHSPAYDPEQLVEGLTDYKQPSPPVQKKFVGSYENNATEEWVATTVAVAEGSRPPDYVYRLTGQSVHERGGHIRCPFSDHDDRNPSTYVYGDVGAGWFCFSCNRGGGPFHLAAALNGWTAGGALRDSEFIEAAKTLAVALKTEDRSQDGTVEEALGSIVDAPAYEAKEKWQA